MREHSELQKEIQAPVLLAHVFEDSTDIFGISAGGGFEHPKPPSRYATDCHSVINTNGVGSDVI